MDRRYPTPMLSAVTYVIINSREFGGFRLDGLANVDEQQRDEAAAPMAGSLVGGGGASRTPPCCVAHQHQESSRHVREAP